MRVSGRLLVAVLALGLSAGAGCKKSDEECSPLASAAPVAVASADASSAPCTKTEDCPRSCLCRDLGRCAKGSGGTCVVGDDDDCRASRVCKLVGHCTAAQGECVAATDADCRASDVCENGGKCTAREGRCVGVPAGAP